MNTEDDEFARIEREATRGIPDAIHHTDTSEPLMYIQGWNDCRAAMLAYQPAPVQEPVFCEHCGGNDEDPQDHCMDCTRPRWEPVTQELLNNQHQWLYESMWIAMKGGTVLQGIYEWRQGRNPDRFITDGGDDWAFDAAYVMPIVKPAPPAIEAAHGIKENT